MKDNTGYEILIEYDKKGNKIHSITSRDSKKISETWYDNNDKGNLIHSRFLDGSEAWYSEEGIIRLTAPKSIINISKKKHPMGQ